MKTFVLIFLLIFSFGFSQKVVIKTDKSNIVVKRYPKKASIIVVNFLHYKSIDNQKFR